MFFYYFLFFAVVLKSSAKERDFNYVVNNRLSLNDQIFPANKFNVGPLNYNVFKFLQPEQVKIQLYYECLCPDCRTFDTTQFKSTVLTLGSNLDVNVYPYGNARTIVDRNGHVEIVCQHGPAECYGNKLHACAIDNLKNITASVSYNSCMMDGTQAGRGSDDAAADVCARAMGINSEPIKQCAKSDKGNQLLKYYGEESKKANFNYVPYVLINGVESTGEHFMQDVCKAFKNPPPACNV